MENDGTVLAFFIRHYYDILSDNDMRRLFICQNRNCGFYMFWRFEPIEQRTCPICGGIMPLCKLDWSSITPKQVLKIERGAAKNREIFYR